MVVVHHAFPHYQAMGTTLAFLQHLSEWGFVGVDIFFIISGFIMAYTTFDKPRGINSAKKFLKHRLFRIYLGYWPFFITMSLILIVIHRIGSMDILGSLLLYNPDMFQLVLPVSWSLTYELYFYLLFLITFLFTRKQLYIYIPFFMIILLVLILSSSYQTFLPLNFLYSPFLLEFFMGVLLYMFRLYFMRIWVLILAIIFLIVAFSYGVEHESKNGLIRILTFGISAFSLVLIALILEHKNFYKEKSFLESLGNASYTLYLSHLIFLELFYLTGLRNTFTSTDIYPPLIGYLFIIAMAIIFSLLYYRFIEKPMYQKAITWRIS
jgi:peptidoglycan/LPS O-acetylase OafA/YrhL